MDAYQATLEEHFVSSVAGSAHIARTVEILAALVLLPREVKDEWATGDAAWEDRYWSADLDGLHALARNPRTPRFIQLRIARTGVDELVHALVHNPGASPRLLRLVASDPNLAPGLTDTAHAMLSGSRCRPMFAAGA